MDGVDIYVFMSLCLMLGEIEVIYLDKKTKRQMVGVIICFYVFVSDVWRD